MKSHILIVEDEADLLSTLEYNFKNEGYRVTITSLGNEAVLRIDMSDSTD